MQKTRTITTVCTVLGLCAFGAGAVADSDRVSTGNAYWWWDTGTPAGSSQIVRTPGGIAANYKTSGLPAGHAMTLWLMFFNNPGACSTSPCTLADAGNPAAGFDFHYVGGHVVNEYTTTISGHLGVGDLGASGWAELGMPEIAVPLTNPLGAEVILAIHSHGPALTGTDLAAQISSYLGGCAVFLGPGGFAASETDIPANPGECSTIQLSTHLP